MITAQTSATATHWSDLPALDVAGPTIQVLPTDGGEYRILRVVLPPAVFIPLHAHAESETVILTSGELEASGRT